MTEFKIDIKSVYQWSTSIEYDAPTCLKECLKNGDDPRLSDKLWDWVGERLEEVSPRFASAVKKKGFEKSSDRLEAFIDKCSNEKITIRFQIKRIKQR